VNGRAGRADLDGCVDTVVRTERTDARHDRFSLAARPAKRIDTMMVLVTTTGSPSRRTWMSCQSCSSGSSSGTAEHKRRLSFASG
jgi:hypothetical protein